MSDQEEAARVQRYDAVQSDGRLNPAMLLPHIGAFVHYVSSRNLVEPKCRPAMVTEHQLYVDDSFGLAVGLVVTHPHELEFLPLSLGGVSQHELHRLVHPPVSPDEVEHPPHTWHWPCGYA
jgi:hypothetical protein